MTFFIDMNNKEDQIKLGTVKAGHCFEADGVVYKRIKEWYEKEDEISVHGCTTIIPCVTMNNSTEKIVKWDSDKLVNKVNDIRIEYNLVRKANLPRKQ